MPPKVNTLNQSTTSTTFKLAPDKGFTLVDLQFEPNEIAALEQIDMSGFTTANHYENYGDLSILETEVTYFLNSLGQNNATCAAIIAKLVVKSVNQLLTVTGFESSWVTMRAFRPMNTFDQPRWHADNYYYPTQGEQFKIAITLKGATTLFYNPSPEQLHKLQTIKDNPAELSKFIDPELLVSPKIGQAVIFAVGTENAPVHSEPPIKTDRLFLSMIPGTKAQLQQLYLQTPEQIVTTILQKNGFYTYFIGPKFGKYKYSPYENTEIIAFKLLAEPPDQTTVIANAVSGTNNKIQYAINLEGQSQVKFTLERGAVITIHDISPCITQALPNLHTEEDLFSIIQQSLITIGRADHSLQGRTAVYGATGFNTVGLFRPVNPTDFAQLSIAHDSTIPLAKNPAAQGMGAQLPFINYSLGLNTTERQALAQLKIPVVGHYENYGDLNILRAELVQFILSLSQENADFAVAIASLIQRVVQQVIDYLDTETAWVTVRAFPAVEAFRQARWHADRYDYPPIPSGEQYKGAVTLKGPGTVFFKGSLEQRLAMTPFIKDKRLLDVAIDKSKLVSAKQGDATIFMIGSPWAPIHSEPHTDQERLFMAIVPGKCSEIKTVYTKTPEFKITQQLLKKGFYCYFIGPKLKTHFIASPYEDTEMLIFNLDSENSQESLLKLIQNTLMELNENITVNKLPDNDSVIKITFGSGGCILIRDISWFFKNVGKITRTEEIDKTLQQYALACELATNQPLDSNKFSARFAYNNIEGTNTTGLFKPDSYGLLSHEKVVETNNLSTMAL